MYIFLYLKSFIFYMHSICNFNLFSVSHYEINHG